ncbi:hypothetical protein GHT06_011116 [Daphnia sinensis]|uniref:Palmitoyltransferase n=1 Tax=Daphnia sinensis TaxID=1820382 RepID=A0AAD5L040_9CRUS|nr:hypothetical protein GHT06_011116 [Daphnia sinensis]
MSWSKVIHIGPLFTIVVIKSIVWSTIHCNSMWWPPYHSWPGFINATIFLLLSASTFYNFLYSLHVGPGYLPLKWKPNNEEDIQYLQYCTVCEGYKAPRSHHCRKCNRCIMKRDHHCIFINNCLGHLNHTSFIVFLISAVIGCAQSIVIISCTMYRALHPTYYYYDHADVPEVPFVILGLWPFVISLISLGLAAGVVFAVGFLFFVQMKVILRNQTAIEDWVHEKAVYRREGTDETPFIHPYNLGWRENLVQVINWSLQPKGDGIEWKVRDNCHYYSFTIEQIEQKKIKRERCVEYVVEKAYSGRWFPFISFGIMVCLRPPCSDETRIPLRIGDIVAVTRWKKYWLYGEIQERGQVQMNPTQRRALRGWFPRLSCSPSYVEYEKEE